MFLTVKCKLCDETLPEFFKYYTDERAHELHSNDLFDEIFKSKKTKEVERS